MASHAKQSDGPFIEFLPSPALLWRILATINSYCGVFVHSDTYRLRKHISPFKVQETTG
jgi:hypothetical protein